MSLISDLLSSLLDMPGPLADAAGVDPISAVSLAVGGLLLVVSLGYVVVLALGAALSLVRPRAGGREFPRAR